jgi:ATP synthase protein I
MSDSDKPPSLSELDARLRKARQREAGESGSEAARPGFTGVAFAFRIGVELVAALAVGAGVGLLVDYWLGTKPWGLVVFFILGWGAGVLNVYRAVTGIGYAVGYPKDEDSGED